MNSETLFSRIAEIVVGLEPRLVRLQKVAATLRQSAGYRWVGGSRISSVSHYQRPNE
jgi:hypothetical protein